MDFMEIMTGMLRRQVEKMKNGYNGIRSVEDGKSIMTAQPFVIFLVCICAMLWGSAFPLLKIGFSIMGIEDGVGGKMYFAGIRFLLAGILMFLWIRSTGKPLFLSSTRQYWLLFLLGLIHNTIQYTFFYIGVANTTGVKAGIISGAGSFFLALFSTLFFSSDRMSPLKFLGLILGFMGIIVVNIDFMHMGQAKLDFNFRLMGEGFVIMGALCSMVGSLLVKRFSVNIHPPLMAAYQLLFGSVFLLIFARMIDPPSVVHFTPHAIGITVYLAFVSAAAFSLWYTVIKYNQLTKVAVYRFLIPVFAAFESALILSGETINTSAFIALVMVSAGIILTSREQ